MRKAEAAPRGPLAGASQRDTVTGGVLPEAAGGEPDDLGVNRDLNDGAAGAVVRLAVADAKRGPGSAVIRVTLRRGRPLDGST